MGLGLGVQGLGVVFSVGFTFGDRVFEYRVQSGCGRHNFLDFGGVSSHPRARKLDTEAWKGSRFSFLKYLGPI